MTKTTRSWVFHCDLGRTEIEAKKVLNQHIKAKGGDFCVSAWKELPFPAGSPEFVIPDQNGRYFYFTVSPSKVMTEAQSRHFWEDLDVKPSRLYRADHLEPEKKMRDQLLHTYQSLVDVIMKLQVEVDDMKQKIGDLYRNEQSGRARCWVLKSLGKMKSLQDFQAYAFANGLLEKVLEYCAVHFEEVLWLFIKLDVRGGVSVTFWHKFSKVLEVKGKWLRKDTLTDFKSLCNSRNWDYRVGESKVGKNNSSMEIEVQQTPKSKRPQPRRNLKYGVQACFWRRVPWASIREALLLRFTEEEICEWEARKLGEVKQQTDEEIIKRFIIDSEFTLY